MSGFRPRAGHFVSAARDFPPLIASVAPVSSSPALVLDDSCVVERDLSCHGMGVLMIVLLGWTLEGIPLSLVLVNGCQDWYKWGEALDIEEILAHSLLVSGCAILTKTPRIYIGEIQGDGQTTIRDGLLMEKGHVNILRVDAKTLVWVDILWVIIGMGVESMVTELLAHKEMKDVLNEYSFLKYSSICGTWLPRNVKILLVAVYAPQQAGSKRALWDFLSNLVRRWNDEAIIMGDFNDVRTMDERLGSSFNASSARCFDRFIVSSGLVDFKLEGYSFTWSHPSASKMSKLYHFLVTEGIISLYPSILALCLDRHLSDQRPILLREISSDFGPTPFWFYQSWLRMKGFDSMVEHAWLSFSHSDSNAMNDLISIDKDLERGNVSDDTLLNRMELNRRLQDIKLLEKRSQLSIRGVFVRALVLLDPSIVKEAFKNHFEVRFQQPCHAQYSNLMLLFIIGCLRIRTISLIGCVYKVITESLSYRLATVIIRFSSGVSLAFVDNRQILDGPFILNEVLNWCKRKRKQAMFFKVDFAKAYDSVRWDYLLDILQAFGFGPNWCRWIRGGLGFVGWWRVQGEISETYIDDWLPTRVNLSRRGVLLDSHLCPLCNAAMEDVQHVFFRCDVARVVLRKICRWWDLDWQEICSFSDWDAWFLSFRLSSRLKSILEGVFYVAWWRIWRLRNQLVFDASPPNRSTIFDDIAPISNYGATPNGSTYPSNAFLNSNPFYTQHTNPLPNAPVYPSYGPTGLFAYFTGCVTPFVSWIEDYPLPDGLKMPSHVGSYNGKGDPDNYLHLFEGAIRIVNYEDLKVKFRSHFRQHKKFTKTHLAVHNIKQREGGSTRAFVTQYTDDTLQILGLHEEQNIFGFVHGLKKRSLVEFLSTDLPTTYKGMIEKNYTWIEAKEVATNGAPNDHREGFDRFSKGSSWDNNKGMKKNGGSRRSRYMSKYCHFHEDHRHDINQCRELKHHIKEVIKSWKLAYLVKGIKKRKTKALDTQLGEWKKGDKGITLVEGPILMINRESYVSKRKSVEELVDGIGEITFPPVTGILSCVDAKERIVVSDKHLEQTVVIEKQLPTSFKRKLQDLLRSNADVFAWTYADITGISRTIMIEGKPFNTEHRLNEYKHIEPVKQKKRGSWSDSGEEDDKKVNNETCLVAQASSEICLGVDLESDEWIKDSGCSKHMTGNRKLFSNYKAYNGGNVIFGRNLRGNIISKGQICDNKCRVTFSEHDSEITKDGKVKGHANMRLIQSLASKELVRNLPKLKFDQHFCDACKIGKQAHASHKAKNIVSTTRCLELLHMDLFGPSAVWSYGGNRYTLVIVDDYCRKVKESLNVTFDETPPASKTSPLVDDDLDEEEEAIKVTEKKNLENDIEDETLEINEIVNIKESRNHPLENVIGNLNKRTLRSQTQNQSNFFCFISTIEPKNVNKALTDDSWIVAMQEELNQFIANDSIDYDETYAPIARLESIRILLAYACALDFKLFQMDVKSALRNGFINEESACVFTDKWSLYELAYGVPTDGPYQTNSPSPDDIISSILIDREGQVHRIRHEEEIDVLEYQILTREIVPTMKPLEEII
ncbi:retrovirus-related pol polyprotein from transposon TNT 1-94 [Tanacetum coccineum]